MVAELEHGVQLEIARFAALEDQEGVGAALWFFLICSHAGDAAILYAPKVGVAVPVVERLAVEERDETFGIGLGVEDGGSGFVVGGGEPGETGD